MHINPHGASAAFGLLTFVNKRLRPNAGGLDWNGLGSNSDRRHCVGAQPDYSRAALARFIEFVVAKGLVHPATAQGWRVATAKVLEELPAAQIEDVRTIDVEATFKEFLNRYPGRLSPSSVGEYRRRVHRAIEEFVRWMSDPGSYAFRPPARPARMEARRRLDTGTEPAAITPRPRSADGSVFSRPNSMA